MNIVATASIPTREMNKTEALYAQHLSLLLKTGEILWFEYEPIKIRLADNTFYAPDFVVVSKDGVLEAHEVKGFRTFRSKSGIRYGGTYARDDAKVKIKVAAERFPVRFRLVYLDPRMGWMSQEF